MKKSDSRAGNRGRKLVQKGKYRTSAGTCTYKIFRDTRLNTTWRLSWRHDWGLIVTIPWYAKSSMIEGFLHKHRTWIAQCIQDQEHVSRRSEIPVLQPGGSILFRGDRFPVMFSNTIEDPSVIVLKDNRLVLPGILKSCPDIQAEIVKWLKQQGEILLFPVIDRMAHLLDVTIRKRMLRDQRTRWASWSPRGTIRINWRLIMAPPEVFDYLVIHELTHAIHPDHSKDFWNAVAKRCNDWKTAREWLKTHSYLLTGFR